MIRSIFLYLDRTYVLQTPARSIWDTGLRLFRQHVAGHPEVERKMVSSLLHLIDTERYVGLKIAMRWDPTMAAPGGAKWWTACCCTQSCECCWPCRYEQQTPHAIFEMRSHLAQMYTDNFQRAFLDATTAFYREESVRTLAGSEVPEFLSHAEQRLVEESDRVVHYLDGQTRRPLVAAVERELLGAWSCPVAVTPLLSRL
jgi:cullin-4